MEQRQKSLDLLQGLAKLTENMTQEEWDIYVKGLNLEEENEMADKCKWVDGKFYPCKGFNGEIHYRLGGRYECGVCKVDIKKPELELVVKKSGGTWVARYKGVDYLYMKQGMKLIPEYKDRDWDWIPIKNLEITDEIAKLRPFIMYNGGPYVLYGIDFEGDAIIEGGYASKCGVHLATVEDLSEYL